MLSELVSVFLRTWRHCLPKSYFLYIFGDIHFFVLPQNGFEDQGLKNKKSGPVLFTSLWTTVCVECIISSTHLIFIIDRFFIFLVTYDLYRMQTLLCAVLQHPLHSMGHIVVTIWLFKIWTISGKFFLFFFLIFPYLF